MRKHKQMYIILLLCITNKIAGANNSNKPIKAEKSTTSNVFLQKADWWPTTWLYVYQIERQSMNHSNNIAAITAIYVSDRIDNNSNKLNKIRIKGRQLVENTWNNMYETINYINVYM